MEQFTIESSKRDQMVEITDRVQALVTKAGIDCGQVIVYVPHTTAGITINENADPDVVHDMLAQLDVMVPWRQPFYRHGEGNSASHVKASMMGSSVTVLIEWGRLTLGQWQGIWFCEFDGPRTRDVYVQLVWSKLTMTEREWVRCASPEPMLEFLTMRASARKLLLLGCACCRRVWDQLLDARSRSAVEVAERFADGETTQDELMTAVDEAMRARDEAEVVPNRPDDGALDAAFYATWAAYECIGLCRSDHNEETWTRVESTCVSAAGARHPGEYADQSEEETAQAAVIRDIFGNPFRPVAVDPASLSPAVRTLARSIYDQRTFDRLPELADALQQAGCTNEMILAHCRGPGPHVRGCWVVDLVLGKS